jgi:hypothetical protein
MPDSNENLSVSTFLFLLLAEKYPDAIAQLRSYHKFTFNFEVIFRKSAWHFSIGASADEIYNAEIRSEMTLKSVLNQGPLYNCEMVAGNKEGD